MLENLKFIFEKYKDSNLIKFSNYLLLFISFYYLWNKIKELDPKTLIYCGHEYTENNLKFALEVNPNNKNLKTFSKKVYKLIDAGKPTVPSLLEDELKCNPFLQTENDEISNYFDEDKLVGLELFSKLRQLKDKF